MPAFITHYIFGNDVVIHLRPCETRRIIFAEHAAFNTGLQGPDFFFYNFPLGGFGRTNPGSTIHNIDGGKFIMNMMKLCQKMSNSPKRDLCLAYALGFIGHYVLDVKVHPYVYYRAGHSKSPKLDLSRHFFIEHDIDLYYKSDPQTFEMNKVINMTFRQSEVISNFIYSALRLTYPDMKCSYLDVHMSMELQKLGSAFLSDRFGVKEPLVNLFERATDGIPLISALFTSSKATNIPKSMNFYHDKWQLAPADEAKGIKKPIYSSKSVNELFDEARKTYYVDLLECERLISSNKRTSPALKRLRKLIGNKSLHSGLDT